MKKVSASVDGVAQVKKGGGHLLPKAWLNKHTSLIPSTSLYTITFNPSLPSQHWSIMEDTVASIIEKIRVSVGRDHRVLLVIIKHNTNTTNLTPTEINAVYG